MAIPKPMPRWTDDLITGDRVIDTHHQALFKIVKRLALATQIGRSAAQLDGALKFLHGYARAHFDVEDARMVALAFPYIETHRAAHRAFLNRVEELIAAAAARSDHEALAAETAAFAVDWFNRHVRLVDMPLIEFIRGARTS
ncbi:MAG: hemerythrin domain-containing protein [Deltaproteobacteria bacterium]|nr:hemerythrin domain-containing protein [Deltaproteobacteria bacterium]